GTAAPPLGLTRVHGFVHGALLDAFHRIGRRAPFPRRFRFAASLGRTAKRKCKLVLTTAMIHFLQSPPSLRIVHPGSCFPDWLWARADRVRHPILAQGKATFWLVSTEMELEDWSWPRSTCDELTVRMPTPPTRLPNFVPSSAPRARSSRRG